MKNTAFEYTITITGNDLDAKTAQSLAAGDALTLARVDDEYDTYEIVVSTADGKSLDMLSYEESIGIAPFMDDGSVQVVSAQVTSVETKAGKSRAGDETMVNFCVEFCYDDTKLQPFCGGFDDVNAFMPQDNALLCLMLYRALDYGMEIITQTHLNRYEFEVDMDDDTKQYFDNSWDDEDWFFACEVLFNESFSKCKVRAKLYSDSTSLALPCDETDAQTMLTFVNHLRIFNDENAVTDCEVEFE